VVPPRAALDTTHRTIEVLHLMGCDRRPGRAACQRRIALDALFGAERWV
jgi:hypothetical protein